MSVRLRLLAAFVALAAGAAAAIAAALLATASARADGDPASDVLYTGLVFYPFDATFDSSSQSQLNELTANAKAAGAPVKVALILKRTDLGVVTALWLKPQQYAQFLAAELAFLYKGPLLIVMPNGFGFWNAGKPVAKQQALLKRIPIRPGPNGFVETAIEAVQKLAAQAGHPLALPKAKGGSGPTDRLLIVGAAVALLALALLFRLRRRLLPR
jgi:MYXO-CTERM domain-containing protein